MVPLGVSFSLLIEDQGLVEVGLSAILDPFDSNQFMRCPWAMSVFQKLCPAPFPPVSLPWPTSEVTAHLQAQLTLSPCCWRSTSSSDCALMHPGCWLKPSFPDGACPHMSWPAQLLPGTLGGWPPPALPWVFTSSLVEVLANPRSLISF